MELLTPLLCRGSHGGGCGGAPGSPLRRVRRVGVRRRRRRLLLVPPLQIPEPGRRCADEDVIGDGSGRGALYSFFHHRSRPSAAAATPSAPKLSHEDLLRSLARSVASMKSGDEEEEDRGGKGEGERPYAFEEEEGEEPRDFGSGPGPGPGAVCAGVAGDAAAPVHRVEINARKGKVKGRRT